MTTTPDQPKRTAERPGTAPVSRMLLGKVYSALSRCVSKTLSVCLPNRCGLCQSVTDTGFCPGCQSLLPWIEHGCQQCGTALACGFLCGQCQNRQFAWFQAIIPFHYIDPVSSLIHGLKYNEKLSLVSPLSSMLATTVIKRCKVFPDALIPVPLHATSLRKRGYNQSAMVARKLGRLLDIPVWEDVIVKTRQTVSQTRLDHKARLANVDGAYKVLRSKPGVSIAVVDDVVTSGATLREVCQCLRNNGYDQISVWAIAKTASL